MAREDRHPHGATGLSGRTYLITGANAGLGYFASEQLVRRGATVIMTGRNPNRLASARAALHRRIPEADTACVQTMILDTANLGSVRAAAATVGSRTPLSGLLLNAGIVHPPKERMTTSDGHELVWATNVLGHYALAGALLLSLARAGGRMVWLGSVSTSVSHYDPVDPELADGYSGWRAYVQSKVATTALGFEADRRLREANVDVTSVVAHPGYAIGGRTVGIHGVNQPSRGKRFIDNLQTPLSHSKEAGARVLVHALVEPEVEGGQFWGPRFVVHGAPQVQRPDKLTRDPEIADRLWHVCEDDTGVHWPFGKAVKVRR
ncbi:SDR family NAD(P)-dependent oxidoreductase [Microbacterium thalassium]|uniref:NAD(P)-dependent dehydrogenase (Short-subunit alcohol dehydrogenase family) n=1 Tax=Microbacterium thalassium TaxID=362649 RepID=A0A7X0FP95_9MICO|nr:SDR family NAD(P)-dependent oxidoreductase [Microbacterium thalassium]MBB6390581.1 NAD(P)-dependent dehydrogenase (short-subunit alcohol dehydrogenase family) [Microbacterium thalassium]GLK25691.1 oxidoreductase [Microbacterium thalassium]